MAFDHATMWDTVLLPQLALTLLTHRALASRRMSLLNTHHVGHRLR